jgi:ZIP family zinc transporter
MLMEWFKQLNPVIQAVLATCFTWGVTALGAAFVFFFKQINQKILDGMLGFAAGVMIAASFWSLIAPAIEMTERQGNIAPWIPAVIGFVAGAVVLRLIDMVLPHLHVGYPTSEKEGIKTSWERSVLLITAITLHNIPEGLAIGVAFGALAADLPSATLAGAMVLALGIGIQNFPEGTSVSVPLRREGFSRKKAFFFGQLSGLVEPIAGFLGAITVITMRAILPYALCFAAGAMIFVAVEELIPESQMNKNVDIATMGTILGFTVMMALDVALG